MDLFDDEPTEFSEESQDFRYLRVHPVVVEWFQMGALLLVLVVLFVLSRTFFPIPELP